MQSMCFSSWCWPSMEVCTCFPLRLLMKWLGLSYTTYDADDIQILLTADGESSDVISEDTDNGNSSNGESSGSNGESAVSYMRHTFQSSELTSKLSITVTTWNVAGRSPPKDLEVRECLGLNLPADIYIIGLQEVVPLSFSNVVCLEDTQPVVIWEKLIRKTLNASEEFTTFEQHSEEDEANMPLLEPNSTDQNRTITYARVASKQLVGIHISIWIHKKWWQHIKSVAVSCVGLGILGCLGNKGSVAVSLLLGYTSFCFICTHLASGDQEGDQARRNADVEKFIHNTRFDPGKTVVCHPQTIYEHNQIIWLGDMNYRINLSDGEIRSLISEMDWDSLLTQDQLKQNLECETFQRWQEGAIMFSPTYKYKLGSDEYVEGHHEGKRRSPAWCDRILWTGDGLVPHEYLRRESQLSDHRPVVAVFSSYLKICSELRNAATFETS